ncbi:MAG: hypothetical protein ABF289_03365 [Clostridiales bacterium]
MKSNSYKIQLYFSFIMVLIISMLFTIMLFLNAIDIEMYIFLLISIFIWPISILALYTKQKSSKVNFKSKVPIKLSIVGWIILSICIFLYNYITEQNITWAYYPVCGITLWPIGMAIYNFIYKKYS